MSLSKVPLVLSVSSSLLKEEPDIHIVSPEDIVPTTTTTTTTL